MDLGQGVYVSKITTDEWDADPEVNGESHYLCSTGGVEVGLTRYRIAPAQPVLYKLPKRETFLVLEGEARIEIAGGPTLIVKAGDMASMPEGAETTWHISAPYKEIWVLS